MSSRVQGTVKWFSNKKGYGFIEPTSENSPTKEDIFVHQSSVTSDGYRTLIEGWVVEFDVVNDDDGKLKADNVTAPGGGPCTGPRRRRRKNGEETTEEEAGDEPQPSTGDESQQRRSKKKQGSKANKPARQQPQWHDILSDSVKEALDKKGIRRTTGTMDVSVGNVRIKLGTRSYTSMAHSDGILAEGTFTCDENGVVGLQWERALTFAADGTWSSEATEGLLASLDLSSDDAKAVGADETPETLWGEGKTDPRNALESNGFQMRRVVLTPKPKAPKEETEA